MTIVDCTRHFHGGKRVKSKTEIKKACTPKHEPEITNLRIGTGSNRAVYQSVGQLVGPSTN